MERFEVRPVQMFDVVDTSRQEGDQIVLNTRDKDEADRVCEEHNAHYADGE
jgi:hypothetical protein